MDKLRLLWLQNVLQVCFLCLMYDLMDRISPIKTRWMVPDVRLWGVELNCFATWRDRVGWQDTEWGEAFGHAEEWPAINKQYQYHNMQTVKLLLWRTNKHIEECSEAAHLTTASLQGSLLKSEEFLEYHTYCAIWHIGSMSFIRILRAKLAAHVIHLGILKFQS